VAENSVELNSLSRPDPPAPVGWPLVERRRAHTDPPPDGVERRAVDEAHSTGGVPTISATPLWPFRAAAYAAAVARAATERSFDNWTMWMCAAVIGAYTGALCVRPIAYRDDQRVRARIGAEQAVITAAVLVTGAWASPFALCLIPTGMLAAFAAGAVFSLQLSGAAVAVLSVQHISDVGAADGLRDSGLWMGLLFLVAFTSGLAHRAALDGARQQQLALDRVHRLAEANSLLFSLTRIAQTLPATLDLDEVLDSTVGRVRSLMDYDSLAVFLFNHADDEFEPIRLQGTSDFGPLAASSLGAGLTAAVASPRTVRVDTLALSTGVAATSRSGLYASLRARGSLVGLIAVESGRTNGFSAQQAEILHGLAEPFGIAIDNARMFRQIRVMAADEERSRIARDLHDRVGSSLAMIGFEVDRATTVAAQGKPVEPILGELREQVRAVVVEVRDTLSDLRAEVSEERDLATVAADFLRRFRERTGIAVEFDVLVEGRLSVPHERELWQILRESMVNVERHAQASTARVVLREAADSALLVIADNGVGVDTTQARADSYGMVGMRERAGNIGASFTVGPLLGGGTEVRVALQLGSDHEGDSR
jgi:signal transduction histidine kinase